MKILKTTADVIARLGGVQAVADMTGRGYTCAHNWKQFGVFPASTFLLLTTALRRRGYVARKALWRMDQRQRRRDVNNSGDNSNEHSQRDAASDAVAG